jgi:hypothetical protein
MQAHPWGYYMSLQRRKAAALEVALLLEKQLRAEERRVREAAFVQVAMLSRWSRQALRRDVFRTFALLGLPWLAAQLLLIMVVLVPLRLDLVLTQPWYASPCDSPNTVSVLSVLRTLIAVPVWAAGGLLVLALCMWFAAELYEGQPLRYGTVKCMAHRLTGRSRGLAFMLGISLLVSLAFVFVLLLVLRLDSIYLISWYSARLWSGEPVLTTPSCTGLWSSRRCLLG